MTHRKTKLTTTPFTKLESEHTHLLKSMGQETITTHSSPSPY